jgi:hypothetical protein
LSGTNQMGQDCVLGLSGFSYGLSIDLVMRAVCV